MTVTRIDAVGFCAHYSRPGDLAFSYALRLSRQQGLQLNVFHFLCDPYGEEPCVARRWSAAELAQLAYERERELRFYYDELAGDYVEVGFRLCFDDSWRELHRCLVDREFQLLVLPRPGESARFCRKPIEEFADSFVCPTVLVGPEPDRFRLNSSAALLADRLELPADPGGLKEGRESALNR
jgi:hypothetical protein